MGTVTNINSRAPRVTRKTSAPPQLPSHEWVSRARDPRDDGEHEPPYQDAYEALDAASDSYLIAKLHLQQERARMERQWANQLANLEESLESAAYEAFIGGVPEEVIHELADHAAEALSKAIIKVEALA